MTRNILARWSERKLAAIHARERARAKPGEAPSTAPSEEQTAPLPEQDLAALPKIEELTAQSDITGFLRPGVPPELRKAALRKAWLVDPAVRDFIGPARDYDYDWNAIGGVPGAGILKPEEVAALLRSIFPDPEAGEAKTEISPSDGETADP